MANKSGLLSWAFSPLRVERLRGTNGRKQLLDGPAVVRQASLHRRGLPLPATTSLLVPVRNGVGVDRAGEVGDLFLGASLLLHQRSRQDEVIMHQADQNRPVLKLLRTSHSWRGPEQILLEEAVAMLLPKAPSIQRRDLA